MLGKTRVRRWVPALLLAIGVPSTFAQTSVIRVRVVDGRTGKPVRTGNLNVWTSPNQIASSDIPLNREGIAMIQISHEDTIRIFPGFDFFCGVRTPGSVGQEFPVDEVLRTGAATANGCGKANTAVKPGEIVVYVRPLTFWEAMRL